VRRAALLLLDEPSSGLNVEETDDMAFWIQDIRHELGITVLMVEHDMTLVSRCPTACWP
jgi:branched-chain amino acid transport system ATP-binding protein